MDLLPVDIDIDVAHKFGKSYTQPYKLHQVNLLAYEESVCLLSACYLADTPQGPNNFGDFSYR